MATIASVSAAAGAVTPFYILPALVTSLSVIVFTPDPVNTVLSSLWLWLWSVPNAWFDIFDAALAWSIDNVDFHKFTFKHLSMLGPR